MAKQVSRQVQVRIAAGAIVCASAAISMLIIAMASPRAGATAAGGIYVANTLSDSVTAYQASSNGNVVPSITISGSNTGLAGPDGIALDSGGNLYVANEETDSITVYSAGSKETLRPRPPFWATPMISSSLPE